MANIIEINTHTALQGFIRKGADVYVAIQGMPDITIKAVKSDVLKQSKSRQNYSDSITDYDGNDKTLFIYKDHSKNGTIYLDGGF